MPAQRINVLWADLGVSGLSMWLIGMNRRKADHATFRPDAQVKGDYIPWCMVNHEGSVVGEQRPGERLLPETVCLIQSSLMNVSEADGVVEGTLVTRTIPSAWRVRWQRAAEEMQLDRCPDHKFPAASLAERLTDAQYWLRYRLRDFTHPFNGQFQAGPFRWRKDVMTRIIHLLLLTAISDEVQEMQFGEKTDAAGNTTCTAKVRGARESGRIAAPPASMFAGFIQWMESAVRARKRTGNGWSGILRTRRPDSWWQVEFDTAARAISLTRLARPPG